MVAPVGNVAPTTQSELAKVNLTGDFDTFLKMLTTQLQNQDPLSPMDTNQMTDQLTQFGQVEQAINMNSKMEQMLAVLSAQNSNQSVNLLGRVVEFESSKLALMTIGTGENDAPIREAVIAYNLPDVADDVEIQVIDPKTKQVVRTHVAGFPLHFAFRSLDAIIAAVRATAVHEHEDDRVAFAVGCSVTPYPAGIMSIWLYLVALVPTV